MAVYTNYSLETFTASTIFGWHFKIGITRYNKLAYYVKYPRKKLVN